TDDEAVAENNSELVVTAALRDLLVDQAAACFLRRFGTVVVVFLALYACPARQPDQPADAPGIGDLKGHSLLPAIAVGGLRLRDHQAGDAILLGVAARLGQTGKLFRDERFELIEADRIDALAAPEQRAKAFDGRRNLRTLVALLFCGF